MLIHCPHSEFTKVVEQMFLEPLGKSKDEVEQEVNSGRFPPGILYKIVYTGQEENRVKSALMKVFLHGAFVPLSFSCRVKEEICECMFVLCTCVSMTCIV